MKKNKILIILLISFAFIIFLNTKINVSANSEIVIDEQISENFTKMDTFIYENTTYSIFDYKNSLNYINATLYRDQVNEYYDEATISGDDPIISIVPKQYFMKEGQYIYIGDEYGFFVNTFQEVNYFNYNPAYTSNLHSYVIVFDIEKNLDLVATTDRAIFKVKVLFQLEFAYVTDEETTFFTSSESGDIGIDSYIVGVEYTLPVDTGYVIPAKNLDGFSEISKYYMTDVSFAGTLYNEQELNINNVGYNPYNDIGSYFTRMDYIYDGLYLEDGRFTWDHIRSITADIAHCALGFTGAGNVISVFQSAISIGLTLNEAFSTKQHNVSNDNYIMEGFYQNRDDQINYYGNPTKTCYAIFNSDFSNSLLYETNDYAKVEYTINHSALNGQTPNYTRLQNEVALKIVDKSRNVIKVGSSSRDHMLRQPVNKVVNLEQNNAINLLKDGSNYFQFTPTYSGTYNFNFNNISNLKVEIDGYQFEGTNLSFSRKLNGGQAYNIIVSNKINGLLTTFKVSVATNLTNITVGAWNNYLVKVTGYSGLKEIKFGSTSQKIKVYDSNFNLIKDNDTNSAYYNFKNGLYYYVLIINNSNYGATGNLTIQETTNSLYLDSYKQINMTKGDAFVIFTPATSGYYSFVNIESTTSNYQFKIYNTSGDITHLTSYKVGNDYIKYEIYLNANTKYYIGYEYCTTTGGYINLIVKNSNKVFDWYIDGVKLVGSDLYLFQGDYFSIQVKVGSKVVNANLYNNAQEQVYYSGGYWYAPYDAAIIPGKILIANDSEIYGININVRPAIQISMSKGSTTSNVKNYLNWNFSHQNPNDQVSFSARFVYTNGETRTTSVTSQERYGQIEVFSPTDIQYGLGTVLANVFIDSVNYYQTTIIDDRLVTIPMTLTNSYPYLPNRESRQFYFAPYSMNTMFNGGNGTSPSPYQINNAWQLDNMRYMIEDMLDYEEPYYMITSYYNLTSNITTSSTTVFYPLPTLRGTLTSSSGMKTITINKLGLESGFNGTGLFTSINGGTVSNITLDIKNEVASTTNSLRKGAIAGYLNSGTVDNCIVKGTFSLGFNPRGSFVGGIVGDSSNGTISNCTSYVNINTYGDAGGILGKMNSGEVSNCVYYGVINLYYVANSISSINANSRIGGIVGWQAAGSVTYCSIYDSMRINYSSSKATDDIYLKPAIGYIIGRKTGGSESNNTISSSSNVNKGELYSFKKGGFLGIGGTTYNQYEYVATSKRNIGWNG